MEGATLRGEGKGVVFCPSSFTLPGCSQRHAQALRDDPRRAVTEKRTVAPSTFSPMVRPHLCRAAAPPSVAKARENPRPARIYPQRLNHNDEGYSL